MHNCSRSIYSLAAIIVLSINSRSSISISISSIGGSFGSSCSSGNRRSSSSDRREIVNVEMAKKILERTTGRTRGAGCDVDESLVFR